MLTRRAALAASALLVPTGARAQAFPSRQVTFLVGFPPGGNIDFLARHVARELGARLGQPVVVENRTGAGGNLATQAMVRAPADGHTIGFAAIPMATNPALMTNLGYDPERDVQMVGQMSSVPVIVVVGAHTPYRTLADLVAAAKARPGDVSMGHGGVGTSGFLAAALFAREAGLKFLPVSFRGTGPIFQSLLGGQIDGTFAVADANLPGLVKDGRIRALAVLQETEVASLPGVPTARSLGFPATTDFRSWHGVMVRAGTPAPVVARLHQEVTAIINQPAIQDAMATAGLEPRTSDSPAAFDAYYRAEMARWAALVKDTGITPE
jgi:tripartite-type tricarboxylate transporter receptor subunit TctC